MEVRNEKPWYASKRFWFNLLTLGIGIFATLGQNGIVDEKVIAIGVPVGNLILNQLTDGAKITL